MQIREQSCTIKTISSYIKDTIQATRLFYTQNHPTEDFIVFIAREICNYLEPLLGVELRDKIETLEEYIQNKKMLWALNGLSGYMALQIVAWAESAVKARLAGELKKVEKSAGIDTNKSNGKRPTKKKR